MMYLMVINLCKYNKILVLKIFFLKPNICCRNNNFRAAETDCRLNCRFMRLHNLIRSGQESKS